MTELDLRAAVSQIISLESMADAEKLEEDLQRQGFVLGDSGTDVLVYHVGAGKSHELWLILDTKNGQWRKEQEAK